MADLYRFQAHIHTDQGIFVNDQVVSADANQTGRVKSLAVMFGAVEVMVAEIHVFAISIQDHEGLTFVTLPYDETFIEGDAFEPSYGLIQVAKEAEKDDD